MINYEISHMIVRFLAIELIYKFVTLQDILIICRQSQSVVHRAGIITSSNN